MKRIAWVIVLAITYFSLYGQPGGFDATFSSGVGPHGTVYAIALQPDGKIIIGGDFNGPNPMRINGDGTIDNTFNGGAINNLGMYAYSLQDGRSWAFALQPDGKIIMGGNFLYVNGVQQNYIARLNNDGTLDTTYKSGSGFNHPVYSLSLQPDGKLIAGGTFQTFKDIPKYNIVRINNDGSLDSTFAGNLNNALFVSSLAPQPDGKIVCGLAMINSNSIKRLHNNGLLDTSFNTGTGFDSSTWALALQPDGKIIAGGSFRRFNGVQRNGIARLNADGSLDSTFDPGTGFDGSIFALILQPDGKVIAGGGFSTFNGTQHSRIIRLNADGSLDTTFDTRYGFNYGFDYFVNSLALQPDGNILAGGSFLSFNENTCYHITRLLGADATGINSTSFASGVSVFPNPNNGQFALVMDQPRDRFNIELFNIHGQRLYTEQLNYTSLLHKEFNFTDVAKGIYLLKITFDKATIVKRVVIE